MFQYRRSGCSLLLVALIAGCRSEQTGPATAPPPPEVTVSQTVSREITDAGTFTGRTEAVETVDVRARVTGYLTEVKFTDGQVVNKGDLLFQIDPRPFDAALENAKGQKAQWEAKLARGKADVERYEKLVPTGAATAQDLDKARADVGEAVAAIQSAEAAIDRAELDLEFARITAPISGRISRAQITAGNLVRGDNELLTTIVALDPIYVYFDVSERDLLQFQARGRAARTSATQPDVRALKIPVQLGLASEPGYPHEGVLDFADNRVNPATGTIRVRGTFDNSQRIFSPGLFARVRVPISDPYQAVLVAERAIGIDQGVRYVLTLDDKNVVKQQFVELGPLQDDGLRVITSGLKPEDWVVVNGLQRARPGKPVTPQKADMPRRAGEVRTAATVAAPGAAETAAPAGH
ncbi:MAG: efflux RND transporter periplasmic adaptor subunit [Planctomycetota bacterium]